MRVNRFHQRNRREIGKFCSTVCGSDSRVLSRIQVRQRHDRIATDAQVTMDATVVILVVIIESMRASLCVSAAECSSSVCLLLIGEEILHRTDLYQIQLLLFVYIFLSSLQCKLLLHLLLTVVVEFLAHLLHHFCLIYYLLICLFRSYNILLFLFPVLVNPDLYLGLFLHHRSMVRSVETQGHRHEDEEYNYYDGSDYQRSQFYLFGCDLSVFYYQ